MVFTRGRWVNRMICRHCKDLWKPEKCEQCEKTEAAAEMKKCHYSDRKACPLCMVTLNYEHITANNEDINVCTRCVRERIQAIDERKAAENNNNKKKKTKRKKNNKNNNKKTTKKKKKNINNNNNNTDEKKTRLQQT